MRAASCWSSQKPGAPMASSSSAWRAVSASGSKVLTNPVELGSELLELLREWLLALLCGHREILALVAAGGCRSLLPCDEEVPHDQAAAEPGEADCEARDHVADEMDVQEDAAPADREREHRGCPEPRGGTQPRARP